VIWESGGCCRKVSRGCTAVQVRSRLVAAKLQVLLWLCRFGMAIQTGENSPGLGETG
jgi:hypothetical protein